MLESLISLSVIVKYPDAAISPKGSSLYLRGSSAGLNWTAGVKMSHSGTDTWSTTLSVPQTDVGTLLQVKALVADSTWQLGANAMFNIYSAPTQNWTITPHFYSGMGRYEYFRNLYNKYSDNFRDLVVYLPPSFSENKYANYPTLIMHDGQNLFNDSTSFGGRSWRCADTLNDQMGRGLMEEIIVVGVDNTADRTDEYTYSVDPEYGGGKGDLYLDFLEETVIPYVKNAFGSRAMLDREYLGILGSSLGGLISCYAGWTRPAVYSRVGCMSSSFWWNTEDFNTTVLEKYPSPTQGLPAGSIFYLDSGTDAVTSTCGIVDEDDCVQTSTVVSHMQYKHWSLDYDLFHYIMPRGQHSEYYWGTRFWSPMEALYPPQALN